MAEYQPITWDNLWLIDKYFPDLPIDRGIPARNPGACAEGRCLAALRVWMRVWYMPPVTYRAKHLKDTRLGYDRFRTWRE